MRKVFLSAAVAAVFVFGAASSGQAGVTENWSGNVPNSGSFEHFTKARASGNAEVWVAVTGSQQAKVQLITCDSKKSNIGSTRNIRPGESAGMGSSTANKRFCMALARPVPAGGSGTTLLSGRIEF